MINTEFLRLKMAKKSMVTFAVAISLLSGGLFSASTAQAAYFGLDEAVDAANQVIVDLSHGKFDSAARLTVNSLVYASAEVMRSNGHSFDADSLISDWNQNAFELLGMRSSRALGDHKPLSGWLAKLYITLEDKVGNLLKAIPILEDINVLNYAIPVVFQPEGSWRQKNDRDWVEYRKHFIPFANIVTFWVSYGACWFVTKKYAEFLKGVCEPGAKYLRSKMGRYWAPWLSDKIFSKYGKVPGMSSRLLPDLATSEEVVQELNLGGFYEKH